MGEELHLQLRPPARAPGAAGAHGSTLALEDLSIMQPSQTQGHALPFLAGWEGSVGTMCSPTVPPRFFLSKQGFVQPNQIPFFYSVSQELFAP